MVGLIGALGGVAFAFGLLSLLLAIFQPAMPALLVWGNLLVGLLLLLVAGALGFDSLRDRMRSGAGRRAGVQASGALVGTALVLVLLGLVGFLSTRYRARFDWSEQGVNTLSDQTLALIDELGGGGDELELLAFFGREDRPLESELLDRYAYASSRVALRFVDPNRRPDLVEKSGLTPDQLLRRPLRVSLGDRSLLLTELDEASITNALLKLSRRATRKVYFLEGHNERRIGSPDDAEAPADAEQDVESPTGLAGFAHAAAALRAERRVVEPLLLATTEEVPDDADVVIVAGPTRPFFEGERKALERYLARGGALLVMVDPRAQTNLYDDLRRWGVQVGDDVVVDAVMSVNRQPTAPVAEQYAAGGGPPHPIGAELGRTVFSMVRSVQAVDGAAGIEPIVLTSPNSWAETGIEEWMRTGRAMQDARDIAGPVPIAVAGRPDVPDADPDAPARIVVFGDSNFATNELLDVFSNRDLFLNAVSWLLGDEESISVRPNVARSSSVQLTTGQLQLIQYLSLFVLPEGIALLGVLAWWTRRRAPVQGT